jgi:hypothetical protein
MKAARENPIETRKIQVTYVINSIILNTCVEDARCELTIAAVIEK